MASTDSKQAQDGSPQSGGERKVRRGIRESERDWTPEEIDQNIKSYLAEVDEKLGLTEEDYEGADPSKGLLY